MKKTNKVPDSGRELQTVSANQMTRIGVREAIKNIITKRLFSGVHWNKPICRSVASVCPFVRVSVWVQNVTFGQNAGRDIKSHSVTALVFNCR